MASAQTEVSAPPSPRRAYLTAFAHFLFTPQGRSVLMGVIGATCVTFGGFGSGAIRKQDPLLEQLHLSWLRYGHGLVLSSVLVYGGVVIMVASWLYLGRRTLAGGLTMTQLRATVWLWLAPLLLAAPMFSRDAYSYLAQGALLRDGFDPYAVGPVANPGPLLDNVSTIWTTTTAPYGPAFILIAKWVTLITGDNVVAGTMLLRVSMLPGLALLTWAVPRLARHFGANPAIALWIAVLNPLVLIHLMGGVHNEMLMVGLMAAGIVLVLNRRHGAGIALVAVAVAVKATAALALPFLVWMWIIHWRKPDDDHPRARTITDFIRICAASLAIFVVVFAAFSLVAGVGLGWLTALSGSIKIINWLTLPTASANLITVVGNMVTSVQFSSVLTVTRAIGAGVMVIGLVFTWWRYRHTERQALMGIVISMLLVVLLSPAALPWYYTWPLAVGAALLTRLRGLAIIAGFSTWMMVIFKPDGSHGLYSWPHVLIATAAGLYAWNVIRQSKMADA